MHVEVARSGTPKQAPTITRSGVWHGVFAIWTDLAGTANFVAEARRAIWSVDADATVFLTRTLQDIYEESMARTSFTLASAAGDSPQNTTRHPGELLS